MQIKRPNAELKIEFLWCELCVLPVFVCLFFLKVIYKLIFYLRVRVILTCGFVTLKPKKLMR